MSAAASWLPTLVRLTDYSGDWHAYVEAVYRYFRQDFVETRPRFEGKRVGIRKDPLSQGKEATFWHLISEGKTEADRVPDLRRCERIRWPRPTIEAAGTNRVKRWRRRLHGQTRALVALEDFSFVVVLVESRRYALLLTAYLVENEHRRSKLRKECLEYQNRMTPPV